MATTILHIDMDAFFAAIEERDQPELAGQAIVVGANPQGGQGRGVVSTCNYRARKFGVRSALPISEAYRRCPQAVFLPVDFKKYAAVSERIMSIVRGFGYPVEQVSVDEAYIDISNVIDVMDFARELKHRVLESEKLTASVGIGPNKLIAKLASETQKPDGLTVVAAEETQIFLDPKPVRALHGVGPKTEERLKTLGITTIAQLRAWHKEKLTAAFGAFGNDLYDMARGIDNQPVEETHEVKSIGKQTTFDEDTKNRGLILRVLGELCREVHTELVREKFFFRRICVTIRYRGFETHTHQTTLRAATDTRATLTAQAFKLALPRLGGRLVRLVGVRVGELVNHVSGKK